MKRRFLSAILCLCMVLALIPTVAFAAGDTADTILFNNHTYMRIEQGMTWTEAKSYCENLGGYLAVITSQEEQAAVQGLVEKGTQKQYWLGGQRQGSWQWVTGEPWSYTNWGRGEPKNYRGVENCLQMFRLSNPKNYDPNPLGKWNDITEDNHIPGEEDFFSTEQVGIICEWDNPGDFADVPANTYYAQAVDWAIQNHIITGITQTTFVPNDICTRGQVMQMLWRAIGSPEPSSTQNPFADVKSSDYFYKAVLWAVENGVTVGTSDTTFSPNINCTRGQCMTFLWVVETKPETSNAIAFTDVKSSDYFYNPVKWAVGKGVTSGTTSTTFSPNAGCTRAQVVTFIYKAMN